jgi:cytochrome c5
MEIGKLGLLECAFAAVFVSSVYAQGPAASGGPATRSAGGDQQKALAAQGKTRFQAYKCYDCHGENGEGTPDAPDLTHSKLTAEQVSKFLVKPSADALNKGMPDIPADNPDNRLLVAYVMSLRAGGNQPASAPASNASKGATASGNKGSSRAAGGSQTALVAKGKERFQAYKCYDCHGEKGEGTPDAPDLTHSKLTAEQVSKFLIKPSADALNKGMPDVPRDSPDHDPLVAYVMSLRAK